MKISKLTVTPVAVPLKAITSPSQYKAQLRAIVSVVVTVSTDDGLEGFGEAPPALGADVAEALLRAAQGSILGKNPVNLNKVMRELYADFNMAHLHPHAGNWALNAIEMALWDLAGKRAGLPLSDLWGGTYRTKIQYFGHVERQAPASMKEVARRLTAEGFKVIYTKVGLERKDDIDAVAAMRDGIGRDNRGVKIRVDPNQAWTPGQAIDMIKEFEPYGLESVDQPVLMYNLDALKRVRDAVSTPISAHESGWTMFDMVNVIKHTAADAVHIDPRFDLGLTGARISAGIAEAAGIPTIAHAYGELGIASAAIMHLIASCPSFTMANQGSGYRELSDDIIQEGMLKYEGPYVELPTGPGLGVTLDRQKVARYHEHYVKEVREKGRDRNLDCFDYTAMYMRNYLTREA